MKKRQIEIFIKALLAITALVTVVGACLEIMHKDYGLLIFMIGLVSFVILMTYIQLRISKGK